MIWQKIEQRLCIQESPLRQDIHRLTRRVDISGSDNKGVANCRSLPSVFLRGLRESPSFNPVFFGPTPVDSLSKTPDRLAFAMSTNWTL